MSESKQNTHETPTINRFCLCHLRENVAQLTQEQLAAALNIETEKVKHWGNRQNTAKPKTLFSLWKESLVSRREASLWKVANHLCKISTPPLFRTQTRTRVSNG